MLLADLLKPFDPKEVQWRAQTVTKDGTKALALAYIDARAVMERLDAVCFPQNWQCRYLFNDKKTICEIGIKWGDEWIWKADGAGDSDVEAEKGALSDAFKRAAVKWGIGRYLYDLPSMWVPCECREFNNKKQFVKFTVEPSSMLPKTTKPPLSTRAGLPPPPTGEEHKEQIAAYVAEIKQLLRNADMAQDGKDTAALTALCQQIEPDLLELSPRLASWVPDDWKQFRNAVIKHVQKIPAVA